MSRRIARDICLKSVFQIDFFEEELLDQINQYIESESVSQKDLNYINTITKGIIDNKNKIDQLIEKYLKGWKINRLNKVDLAIIRIAVYEMIFLKDTPNAIIINEAIELSKKYSEEKSTSFINALLDTLSKKEK